MKKIILISALMFSSLLTLGQISNGLIAHFNFDNSLSDDSPSNISLNNSGCSYIQDRNNNSNSALLFGGSNYLDFNDNSVKVPLPITISAWVKMNSFAENNVLIRSDNVFEDYHGYWVNFGAGTGNVSASIAGGLGGSNPSNRRTFTSDLTLQVGVWNHLVIIIRDYDDMEIYIDCEKSTGTYSGTGSTVMTYSTSESRIGSGNGMNLNPSGSYFDGSMDQVAIWNRALSTNEFSPLCQRDTYLNLFKESLGSENKNSVTIYPNPANNVLNIKMDKVEKFQATIIDNQGREVINSESTESDHIDFNIPNLTKGIYTLVIRTEKGITSEKFVKL